MIDILSSNNWIERSEVFLATLHTLETPQGGREPESSRAVYLSYLEDGNGKVLEGHTDWVIASNEQIAYPFRFLFQSRTSNRLRFMITGSGADQDKKLGISRNGYLGLYKFASVTDYIKLEPLEWSEDALVCRLRDHLGHQVKARHDSPVAVPRFSYLNVQKGTEIRFLLRRTEKNTYA